MAVTRHLQYSKTGVPLSASSYPVCVIAEQNFPITGRGETCQLSMPKSNINPVYSPINSIGAAAVSRVAYCFVAATTPILCPDRKSDDD